MDTSNNMPKNIVDKIMIQAEIDALLYTKIEDEIDYFNPYSLEPVVRLDENELYDRNRFVKQMKGYNDEAFMSEVNVIGLNGDKLNGLCFLEDALIKVDIPGTVGNYYITTSRLRQMLKEYGVAEYPVSYDDGLSIVKLLCVDKQLLLDVCEIR